MDVVLEAVFLAEGEIVVRCQFFKNGESHDVGAAPTRQELTQLCREAAKITAMDAPNG